MEYRIQVIQFNGKKTHRILQNVGGPCPLLGLCNVLLLNNDIRVNQKISFIKFNDLTHCLKDHLHKLFEVNMGSKSDVDESQMANAIKNIEDCIALFPKLEEGLDINIKFSDVTDFEYTSAIAMFDSYTIRLLHGWCVDPQDTQLYNIIKDKSYNEVVDFLTSDIDSKENDAEIAKIEQQKAIVRQFLSDYQQQLTAHGLFRLHEVMNDNEIAIFFRNNHFSAVYKRQGQIWELVTDEGIVDADPRITWQSLSQLSGDEEFVSNKFTLISQNINQQQQMESYNLLKQRKDEQKQQQTDGFSIEEQEAYLKKQYDETNTNNDDNNNDDNDNNNNDDNDNNNTNNDDDNKKKNHNDADNNNDDDVNNNNKNGDTDNNNKSKNISANIQDVKDSNNNNNNSNNTKAPADALDNEIAQRIALEQQLGLESGQLERLQKEQQEAMDQIKIQQQMQQEQQEYNNNNAMSSNQQNQDPYGVYNGNIHSANNNGAYVYAQQYENQQKANTKRRKKKHSSKKSDDSCIIL